MIKNITQYFEFSVCIQELKSCQSFYHQVKKAQERLSGDSDCDLNALVKVEIKQEPKEEESFMQFCDAQSFDFFQSFEANDSDSLELEEKLNVGSTSKTSSDHQSESKPRIYNRLSPTERKKRGNRGIRRAKEAIKITTGKKEKLKLEK